MRCDDVLALVDHYLDGELTEELCARVERHLLRCGACRDEIHTLRLTLDTLAESHAHVTAGEGFVLNALTEVRSRLGLPDAPAPVPGQLVLLIPGDET